MNDKLGKTLRTLAIVLMGLTAAMNILGGVGTVCAAFLTKSFPPMWALLDYQWLYQILMIVTILIGLAGAWLTARLSRGAAGSYRTSLILLVLGTLFAGIQVAASLALRGKAVPANFKLYANALTLVVFLVIRLPGLWQRVGLENPRGSQGPGLAPGLAAMTTGFLVLTTSLWVGTSHTYEGNNWVHVLWTPLLVSGSVLILGGGGWLVAKWLGRRVVSELPAASPIEASRRQG